MPHPPNPPLGMVEPHSPVEVLDANLQSGCTRLPRSWPEDVIPDLLLRLHRAYDQLLAENEQLRKFGGPISTCAHKRPTDDGQTTVHYSSSSDGDGSVFIRGRAVSDGSCEYNYPKDGSLDLYTLTPQADRSSFAKKQAVDEPRISINSIPMREDSLSSRHALNILRASAKASHGVEPTLDEASPATLFNNASPKISVHSTGTEVVQLTVPKAQHHNDDAEDGDLVGSQNTLRGPMIMEDQPPEKRNGVMFSHWDPDADLYDSGEFGVKPTIERTRTSLSKQKRTGDRIEGKSWAQRFVMRPGGARNICWDILSIFVMSIDFLLTPMMVFGIHYIDSYPSMAFAVTSFWTSDIAFTCFVGFYRDGLMEMRPAEIVRQYAKGWMVLDILLVSVDWLVVLSGTFASASSIFRVFKTIRILRIMRMVRLFRLVKLIATFNNLDINIQSQAMLVMLRVTKNIMGIVIVNHFIACGFYGVAEFAASYGYLTWVDALRTDKIDEAPSVGYQYTSALHWALTQFTPASMEVAPHNAIERVYTVCVMIFSVMVFSSLVGSISAAMTHLRDMNAEQSKQLDLVHRYVSQHRVSVDLGNRVCSFLRLGGRKVQDTLPLLERHVPAIKGLPETLRLELHTEVFANVLNIHPFFRAFEALDHLGTAYIAHNAMTDCVIPRGGFVFKQGAKAMNMFFLMRGRLTYSRFIKPGPESPKGDERSIEDICRSQRIGVESPASKRRAIKIDPMACLCEYSLWVWWHFSGSLIAADSDAELFVLSAPGFAEATRQSLAREYCAVYAKLYAQDMQSRLASPVPVSKLDVINDRGLSMDLRDRALSVTEPVRSFTFRSTSNLSRRDTLGCHNLRIVKFLKSFLVKHT